jgi:hypothetical protein
LKLRELSFSAAGGEDAEPKICRLINTMLDSRHIITSSADTLKDSTSTNCYYSWLRGVNASYLVGQYGGGFSGRHHLLPHLHRNNLLQPNSYFMHFRYSAHKVKASTNSFIIKNSLPVKLHSPTIHFHKTFTTNFSPEFN